MNHYIKIYTDGACSGNPGPGGWGYVILVDGLEYKEENKGYRMTTNNRMEIAAAIYALQKATALIERYNDGATYTICVNTDSQHLAGTMNLAWKRRTNLDLWQRLDETINKLRSLTVEVCFEKVKGHSGDRYNEVADRLAVAASCNKQKMADTNYEKGCENDVDTSCVESILQAFIDANANADTYDIAVHMYLTGFRKGYETSIEKQTQTN